MAGLSRGSTGWCLFLIYQCLLFTKAATWIIPHETPPRSSELPASRRAVLISSSSLLLLLETPDVASAFWVNPFRRLDTVGAIPPSYFKEHVSIYAYTERVIDGDTLRVRHIPGYPLLQRSSSKDKKKHGLAEETLILRLYGIDCPELAKSKNATAQPFALKAKEFTTQAVNQQMVKVTLLRKDRYGRAIAKVETLPAAFGFLSSPKDLSMALARQGLAQLYTGGGAEYNVRTPAANERKYTHDHQHRGTYHYLSLFESYLLVSL